MYDVRSMKAEEFISDEEILATLEYADQHKHDRALIESGVRVVFELTPNQL